MQDHQHHARTRPSATIRTSVEDDGPALALIDHATWSSEVSPTPPWPPGTPFFDDRTAPENVRVAPQNEHIQG